MIWEHFLQTENKPVMVRIRISTPKKTTLNLKVLDPYRINTVFDDRGLEVTGTQDFYIRMPLSPATAKFIVEGDNFKVTALKKQSLPVKFNLRSVKNTVTVSFLKLIEEFALNAGYAPTDRYYISDDEMFVIKYLDTITDRTTGQELTTPMRIGENTQVIEVSAKRVKPMTVPMRVAIGLHEFAHLFKNDNPDNETEADLQSLFVFLSCGFPRSEAYYAWLDVFDKSSKSTTELPEGYKRRISKIKWFIDNFDDSQFSPAQF